MENFKLERYVDTLTINNAFSGKSITKSEGLKVGNDVITIYFGDEFFEMYHSQSCCENVEVEDINGDTDLVGTTFYEIIEKECNKEALDEYTGSYTWTFYTIRTSKGYLDIRWYGTSNGYYSERVDLDVFYKTEEEV